MTKRSKAIFSAGGLRQVVLLVFRKVLKNTQLYSAMVGRGLLATFAAAISRPLPLPLPDYWQKNGKKGFTLLELMMVIAIIGTLAAIAIPNYIGYRERASTLSTLETMRMMDREIVNFNITNGRFPNSLEEAGLDLLKDPWGNPYQYLNIETSTGNGKRRKNRSLVPINQDFDLYSMGPDGKSVSPLTAKHSRDDIIRANNGSYFGTAANY